MFIVVFLIAIIIKIVSVMIEQKREMEAEKEVVVMSNNIAGLNTRMFYDIRQLLINNGYEETAQNDNYIWNVIYYLDTMCPNDYTIFDWLRDTKFNYPEDLK